MKICKNKKHSHIVFSEGDYAECPMCGALETIKFKDTSIDEMHEQALIREEYIAKIEVQNTKMEEAVKSNNLFTYETITWDNLPPVKPPKKRSHKPKSTPKENNG